MKKILWLIIIVVAAFVFYRLAFKSPAEPSAPAPIAVELSALAGSGQSGVATLEEVDGQVKVTIQLTAASPPAAAPQPAHVHKGSCAALGEPIYTLSPVVGGASETILTVSRRAIEVGLPLAINIHESSAAIDVYVACGEITPD